MQPPPVNTGLFLLGARIISNHSNTAPRGSGSTYALGICFQMQASNIPSGAFAF